jgi:replicative DNA helicase
MSQSQTLDSDEVMEITDVGEMDTYDLSMPGTHCFFANGVLVHNSGSIEEDADTVLLLHRPELYGDPAKKVDEGLLNIKVAKHRQLGVSDLFELHWNKNHYEVREDDKQRKFD